MDVILYRSSLLYSLLVQKYPTSGTKISNEQRPVGADKTCIRKTCF